MEQKPEKRETAKTILFYALPAYGHIHSNLYLTGRLAKAGFRVVYYATEPYREEIEANGGEYRAYPLGGKTIDTSDGNKLLKLYRLILEYTRDMLPVLLSEAAQEKPCHILFDSLALWGRAVGELLSVPSFSFYSIAAIDRIGGRAFFAYASGFSGGFLRYAGELPQALRIRRQLGKSYGIWKLGMLPVLMNKGSRNLMGYSRMFQPGGGKLGEDYVFLGPLSPHMKSIRTNDFICPPERLIYISLGTVFNRDRDLLREILRQFGRGKGAEFHVVMAWNIEKTDRIPDNFIVRPFVNQGEILKHASLFITAGGMNSIHEALYYGVPCLMCPQQGEQLINAKRFEAMGFGRILRKKADLYREAMAAMALKNTWSGERRKKAAAVHVKAALNLLKQNNTTKEERRQGE